jgi:hypothetical protein
VAPSPMPGKYWRISEEIVAILFVRSESVGECPKGARGYELGSLLAVRLLCHPRWPVLLGRNNCVCHDDQY